MSSTKTSPRTIRGPKPSSAASGGNGSGPASVAPKPNPTARGRATNGTQPTKRGAKSNVAASAASGLTALIDAALADMREADPHVIARRLLPNLTEEMREKLLLVGLTDRVSQAMARARSNGIAAPVRREGPSKWEVAKRVWVAGEHKLLADCDFSDLMTLGEQHREISARNIARAVEYEQLAAELREAGCATVRELWERKDLAA